MTVRKQPGLDRDSDRRARSRRALPLEMLRFRGLAVRNPQPLSIPELETLDVQPNGHPVDRDGRPYGGLGGAYRLGAPVAPAPLHPGFPKYPVQCRGEDAARSTGVVSTDARTLCPLVQALPNSVIRQPVMHSIVDR
jgi:hypothetical protein